MTAKTQLMTIEHYVAMIRVQSRTLGVVLKSIGHLFNNVAATDEWKDSVNAQSQNLADLYNVVDSIQPPDDYRDVHTLVRRSILKANQAMKLAIETMQEDIGDKSAWAQARFLFDSSGRLIRQAGQLHEAKQQVATIRTSEAPEPPVVA